MRTKVIALFIITLFSIQSVYAKKAKAIWYFLEKTQTSVTEDNNISVQYGIYTKYANTDYNLGPYPTLRIKITNKSDKVVFVDLGTSYVKKNDVASVIYTPSITTTMIGTTIGMGVNVSVSGLGGIVGTTIGSSITSSMATSTYAQRYVSIPPKSSVFLEDIPILTPGSEAALGNFFYFDEIGAGEQKRLWCVSVGYSDVKYGSIYEYTEDETMFNIGCYLNYSFTEDFKKSNAIETTYYLKKLIGTTMSTFPPGTNAKEYAAMDELFPEWRQKIGTGELELIRLWIGR